MFSFGVPTALVCATPACPRSNPPANAPHRTTASGSKRQQKTLSFAYLGFRQTLDTRFHRQGDSSCWPQHHFLDPFQLGGIYQSILSQRERACIHDAPVLYESMWLAKIIVIPIGSGGISRVVCPLRRLHGSINPSSGKRHAEAWSASCNAKSNRNEECTINLHALDVEKTPGRSNCKSSLLRIGCDIPQTCLSEHIETPS